MGALEKGGDWAGLIMQIGHPEHSIDVRVQNVSFQA